MIHCLLPVVLPVDIQDKTSLSVECILLCAEHVGGVYVCVSGYLEELYCRCIDGMWRGCVWKLENKHPFV